MYFVPPTASNMEKRSFTGEITPAFERRRSSVVPVEHIVLAPHNYSSDWGKPTTQLVQFLGYEGEDFAQFKRSMEDH